MRILFVGSVLFSLKILEKLIDLEANIVGVGTKKKSSFNTDFCDLSFICDKVSIPYKYIGNINDKENIEWIQSLKPDFIFCFGWSFLLTKDVLNIAPTVGYHPSKLPKNRGRHPLIWALVLGLENSASTFFLMDEGADSGSILSQVDFDITYEDNAQSLYDKMTRIALSQVEDFLPKLQNDNYQSVIQDDSQSNIWRKRSKKDGLIDFRMTGRAIYNLVRALHKPYPGAFLIYKSQEISIWQVEEVDCQISNIEHGKVLEVKNDMITVKCYDKAIRIIKHEFKPLPQIGDYL